MQLFKRVAARGAQRQGKERQEQAPKEEEHLCPRGRWWLIREEKDRCQGQLDAGRN